MKLRKLLTWILVTSILMSIVPASALAQETFADTATQGSLFLDKTAELTADGTYTINLEAYATGTTLTQTITEGVPLDVVLVVDQSGSLRGEALTMLKNSVNVFLESLRANGEECGVNHRVAMCGFASYGKQGASAWEAAGYSYANTVHGGPWVNTGIFVDGKFKDYGEAEYIPITSYDQININSYYAIWHDSDGDGINEYSRVFMTIYEFQGNNYYCWVAKDGSELGYTPVTGGYRYGSSVTVNQLKQLLFNEFKGYLFEVGETRNLLSNEDYAASWENVSVVDDGKIEINPVLTEAVGNLSSNGATATFIGLKMARKMLENLPTETDNVQRKKLVVVFTDGEPGAVGYAQGDADAALAEASKIKAGGTEIYAVGIYDNPTSETIEFMNQLSSNYGTHSFNTNPQKIDVSIGSYTEYNGVLLYTRNDDATRGGVSPYFYKDNKGNYWPVYLYSDPVVSDTDYYAYYITDEGEIPLGSGTVDEFSGNVYLLNKPTASSIPDKGYYKTSTNIDDLGSIFETISTEVTSYTSQISLDAGAVLKDVLADGFILPDNAIITVSVVPGSMSGEAITWGEAQEVLSFNYSAEAEKSGTVKVRGAADQTEMTLTAKVEGDTISVTGFNYAKAEDADQINAQYISEGHPGSKLVVTVTGVEATADVVTDAVISTNDGISGVYESATSDMDEDGEKGELQVPFKNPTTYFVSSVYVMDYAKPMSFHISDLRLDSVISVDDNCYNGFTNADQAITEKYGKVEVNGTTITYTPNNMNWDGYDTFYVFGTTSDTTVTGNTANAKGYVWTKVCVVPANNVYYEDSFVNSRDSGTAGIIYEGAWNVVGTSGNQGENAESGENADHGGVHGWEDTLADDGDFTDGSAHVSETPGATATFTFTGTGVDIYSRTNSTTGIIIAMLYKGSSVTGEDGKNLIAEYALMVDNLSVSGDYYQVPTLSLCQIPVTDENGNTVMTDLDYGTYTVKIIVSKATNSQNGNERFLYYLDGIRVYNPIKNQEDDSVVNGAYGERNELNANFVEIRDKLLDAGSFADGNTESAGPVFIDRITSEEGNHSDKTTTTEISTYEVFGPKNEVYLSAGQMIAFAVEYQQDAHYYIGLKSLTGKLANVKLCAPNFDAEDNAFIVAISHTTDLYYEVFPVWEYDAEGNPTKGVIAVMFDAANSDADAILSLTKLKTTCPNATTLKFARISNIRLLTAADDLAKADIVATGDTTPDSSPAEGEQTILQKLMMAVLKRVFGDLRGWFKP